MNQRIHLNKSIVVLHIVLAVYSLLGIASKLAAGEDFLSLKFCLYYGVVIGNLGLYAIVWQQLLKRLPLITAYANKAVTVIWGVVYGYLFFGEAITVQKVLGGAIIIIGVYLVVTADRDDPAQEKIDDTAQKEDAPC